MFTTLMKTKLVLDKVSETSTTDNNPVVASDLQIGVKR